MSEVEDDSYKFGSPEVSDDSSECDSGEIRQDKGKSHHPLLGQSNSGKWEDSLEKDGDEAWQASNLKGRVKSFCGMEI